MPDNNNLYNAYDWGLPPAFPDVPVVDEQLPVPEEQLGFFERFVARDIELAEEQEEDLEYCEECDGNENDGHSLGCSNHPAYAGTCDYCDYVMNDELDAYNNHSDTCEHYPGNYRCNECDSVIVGGDEYEHSRECSQHADSWYCEDCGEQFGPDISEDEHNEEYHGGPPVVRGEKMAGAISNSMGDTKNGILGPLLRVRDIEEVALKALYEHEKLVGDGSQGPLWCGDLRCPVCYSAYRALAAHKVTASYYSDELEGVEWEWGKSPYKVGTSVYLVYDTSKPQNYTVAEVKEGDEEYVNGVGIRLNKDDSQLFYDLMWIMPNSGTASIALKEIDAHREEWGKRGYAPTFILNKGRQESRTKTTANNVQPYYPGDIAWLTRHAAVTKVDIGAVMGARASTGIFNYSVTNVLTGEVLDRAWGLPWLLPTERMALEEFERMNAVPVDERIYEYPYSNWKESPQLLNVMFIEAANDARLQRVVDKVRAHIEEVKARREAGEEVGESAPSLFPELLDKLLLRTNAGVPKRYRKPGQEEWPLAEGEPVIITYWARNARELLPNPTRVIRCIEDDDYNHNWAIECVGDNGREYRYDMMYVHYLDGTPVFDDYIVPPEEDTYYQYAQKVAAEIAAAGIDAPGLDVVLNTPRNIRFDGASVRKLIHLKREYEAQEVQEAQEYLGVAFGEAANAMANAARLIAEANVDFDNRPF